MRHVTLVSRSPELASDVAGGLAVLSKLTSAVISIYSTVWFTKNWEEVLNEVNEIAQEWQDELSE